MEDPVIHDTNGVQIHVGSVVKEWNDSDGESIQRVPGGVVTRLQGQDVDYNDEGVPEGFGPFVFVHHDGDDEEVRYDVTDTRKITWSDYMMPTEHDWVCEDIEVEVPADPNAPPTDGGGRAYALAHLFADWAERNGFDRVAERLRNDYPF